MRHPSLLWIAIFLSTTFAVAQPPMAETKTEVDTTEFEPLANQLIDALQREDIVAFSQCWISYPQMQQLASAINEPKIQKELEKMKPYIDDRNKHLTYAYGRLVEELKKQGSLADLKRVSIKVPGGVREQLGMRKVSMFHIQVRLGETESTIEIDDGFEHQKQWYFSDKAMNLKVGEGQGVRLQLRIQNKLAD